MPFKSNTYGTSQSRYVRKRKVVSGSGHCRYSNGYPENGAATMKRAMPDFHQVRRKIQKDALRANSDRDEAFVQVIRSIPRGKVSTYGKVAAAAGYPLYHRAVAKLLRTEISAVLPWHRVVGAGGQIKLRFDAEEEQRLRLKMEGVTFNGKLIDMDKHEHELRSWEAFE
jgi:methylated-DNA-protein-cysteine methyltransferase-like protein